MTKQKTIPIKIKSQSGFTFWSLLFTGGVVVFFVYIGVLLVPVYTTDKAVGSALKNAVEGVPLPELRKRILANKIKQKLNIDSIYNGPDIDESIEIKKTKGGTVVTIKYRKDIPLFYNIGMHLDFDHEEIK